MKVRRITDTSRLNEIIVRNGNSMLIPVSDGVGNLIVGPEVLADPAFEKVWKALGEITEEIEHIPFTERTVEEVAIKLEQFRQEGKILVVEAGTGKVDFGGVKIDIRDANVVEDVKSLGLMGTIMAAGRSAVNWVTNLFK